MLGRDQIAAAAAKARLRFISDPAATIEGVAREVGLHHTDVGDRARLEDWHGARADEQKRLLAEIRKQNASQIAAKAEAGLNGLMTDLARLRALVVARTERRLLEAEPSLEEQDTIVQSHNKEKNISSRVITRKRMLAADAKIMGRLLEIEANVCAAIVGADIGGTRDFSSNEDLAAALQQAVRKMRGLTGIGEESSETVTAN